MARHSLADQLAERLAQPDVTRVAPARSDPSLISQIFSRFGQIPEGVSTLFNPDSPANRGLRAAASGDLPFQQELREIPIGGALAALAAAGEDPGIGIATGMIPPVSMAKLPAVVRQSLQEVEKLATLVRQNPPPDGGVAMNLSQSLWESVLAASKQTGLPTGQPHPVLLDAFDNFSQALGRSTGKIAPSSSFKATIGSPQPAGSIGTTVGQGAAQARQPAQLLEPIQTPSGPLLISDQLGDLVPETARLIPDETRQLLDIGRVRAAIAQPQQPASIGAIVFEPAPAGARGIDLGFSTPAFHGTDVSAQWEGIPFARAIAKRDPGGVPNSWTHAGTTESANERLIAKITRRVAQSSDFVAGDIIQTEGVFSPQAAQILADKDIVPRILPVQLRGPFLQVEDQTANVASELTRTVKALGILPDWQIRMVSQTPGTRAQQELMGEFLRARGIKGLRYVNDIEDTGSISYLIFDPADIRSAQARFEPGQSDLAGLMRGLTPLLGAGAAAEIGAQRSER